MGTSLHWKPTGYSSRSLSDELKHILRKIYGYPISANLDYSDLIYFRGLRDAGIEDADVVIDAIERYDYIIITED